MGYCVSNIVVVFIVINLVQGFCSLFKGLVMLHKQFLVLISCNFFVNAQLHCHGLCLDVSE